MNLQNPGFEDVEDAESSQTLVLGPQDYGLDNKINLKTVKFQRVNRYINFNNFVSN